MVGYGWMEMKEKGGVTVKVVVVAEESPTIIRIVNLINLDPPLMLIVWRTAGLRAAVPSSQLRTVIL